MKFASIIVDINTKSLDKIFYYSIPANLEDKVKIGMRVNLPFGKGNRAIQGYIIDIFDFLKENAGIKDIALDENIKNLANFIQIKYDCTLELAIKYMISRLYAKQDDFVFINNQKENIQEEINNIILQNDDQAKVLTFLKKNKIPISLNNLKKDLSISTEPIELLLKKHIIKIEEEFVKDILSITEDFALLDENMIKLAKFISNKYYCTLTVALQCVIPKVYLPKQEKYICINNQKENIQEEINKIILKNNYQSKVLTALKKSNEPLNLNSLKKDLNIKTMQPINALLKKNVIKLTEPKKQNIDDFKINIDIKNTKEQQMAIDFIKQNLYLQEKKPILLHGVTGSGKTEVYIQIIKDLIENGKQAIVLVPEISLTMQMVTRFIKYFADKVSVTHSKLTPAERFLEWEKAKKGEISIMIGARSAIFTPFKNLGAIIIDEEHSLSYYSETTPKYSAIEVASERAVLENAQLILGSATPSILSYYKAKQGLYNIIKMGKRINRSLLDINIIDMRKELENGNNTIFSAPLFNAIEQNLQNKLQTILFLNRRGHSTCITCRKCGYVSQCEKCNVNLTYHLKDNKLMCHYCNSVQPVPNICPACGSKYIKYIGLGTQKIEKELLKAFPYAKILRMDLDTTNKKNSHKFILEKFKNKEADILIGTQMITKGLDFPYVSLVGVIMADLSLNMGHYKSYEITFQLLTQVAGRAGRANTKGEVFIQTYNPENYVINFVKEGNYELFYEKEIEERKIGFYPPFASVFFVMLISKKEELVQNAISKLNEIMKHYNKKANFQISTPTKAAITKINNYFRYKIVIKANSKDEERLKRFVLYCVERLNYHIDLKEIYVSLSLNPNYLQ